MDGTAAERTAPTEVFLVRHGERVDETAEAPLFYLNCGDRGWDPPLTQEGRRQADHAGRELLRAHQQKPFSCVLYSPCLRTLETAARIATVLGLPLRCVPGLAECAAAVKSRRIASFDPSNTSCSRPPLPTQEQALAHCPAGVRFLRRSRAAVAAAVERAAASGGGPRVATRSGTWQRRRACAAASKPRTAASLDSASIRMPTRLRRGRCSRRRPSSYPTKPRRDCRLSCLRAE